MDYSMLQVMAWYLFDTEPLTEAMMTKHTYSCMNQDFQVNKADWHKYLR